MYRAIVIRPTSKRCLRSNRESSDLPYWYWYINKCCKKMVLSPDSEEIHKKCHSDASKTPTDIAMCLATKKGIVTTDGKLDMAKVNKYIEEEFKAVPDLIKVVKEACVEGDVSKYGRPDFDEIANFFSCEAYQHVNICPDASDDAPCDGGRFRFKKIE
ncbi:hypothetical protein ABMA28_002314 [Loxostege sticticalis]|uniref:Uncharacterized protein n=1 Tax=Loxostege sticticalis TaxID=481309 RepID=A0ABD0T4P5_LOXSC